MTIWQHRFNEALAPDILCFTHSVKDDVRLIDYEIKLGIAHIRMLRQQGLITSSQAKRLIKGLKALFKEHKSKPLQLKAAFEDVHINIEKKLQRTIGKLSELLHTGRSRNDLVATDMRLYCRDQVINIMRSLLTLEATIVEQARTNLGVVIPGYTHLQQAQPILWSFYLLSYFYKFQRDFSSLQALMVTINTSSLGSCALAGTGLPIDPEYLRKEMGFARSFDNALDSVSDRDFLTELIFYTTLIMLHISSLSEDLIIYATKEFSLIALDDCITTGSSIMPQKKNPDVCELLRAKAGRAIGNLVAVLSILKALPAGYNRDLQETKAILFAQVELSKETIHIIDFVMKHIKVIKHPWAEKENFICTTDLVEYLVIKGKPFRASYQKIGQCVRDSKGDLNLFIKICATRLKLKASLVRTLLKPQHSIKEKSSPGSTGLQQTRQAIKNAQRILKRDYRSLQKLIESRG